MALSRQTGFFRIQGGGPDPPIRPLGARVTHFGGVYFGVQNFFQHFAPIIQEKPTSGEVVTRPNPPGGGSARTHPPTPKVTKKNLWSCQLQAKMRNTGTATSLWLTWLRDGKRVQQPTTLHVLKNVWKPDGRRRSEGEVLFSDFPLTNLGPQKKSPLGHQQITSGVPKCKKSTKCKNAKMQNTRSKNDFSSSLIPTCK